MIERLTAMPAGTAGLRVSWAHSELGLGLGLAFSLAELEAANACVGGGGT